MRTGSSAIGLLLASALLVAALIRPRCPTPPGPGVLPPPPPPPPVTVVTITPPPPLPVPTGFPPVVVPTQPPAPPVAVLPVPPQCAVEVATLVAKYGLLSIRGSQVNPVALQNLDAAYARIPKPLVAGLDVIFESQQDNAYQGGAADGSGCAGLYTQRTNDGGDRDEGTTASIPVAGGRIRYFDPSALPVLLIHEVGHHIADTADAAFGVNLSTQLGYTLTNDGGYPNNPLEQLNFGTFASTNVQQNSYPTDYAQSNQFEHLAEVICAHCTSQAEEQSYGGDSVHADYGLPAQAVALLAQELGAPCPGSMETTAQPAPSGGDWRRPRRRHERPRWRRWGA